MILATNLTKKFGKFTAVDSFNLELKENECLGLLGPNGAGKSTFINMVYGNTLKTSGNLEVFNMNPTHQSRQIKKKLGVVPQENALDESLTIEENMLIYAAFVGVDKSQRKKKVDDLLDFMNLSHKKDAKILSLSGGMKRRLVFVRALLNNPQLLILDEPTTGLDPAVRHLLWGKVKDLKSQGVTILLTTHYMHEAEILCDRVAIMNAGKIINVDRPQKLIETYTPGYVAVFTKEPSIEAILDAKLNNLIEKTSDQSGIYLRSRELDVLLELQKQIPVRSLQIRPSNLEDVFLKLTGSELGSEA